MSDKYITGKYTAEGHLIIKGDKPLLLDETVVELNALSAENEQLRPLVQEWVCETCKTVYPFQGGGLVQATTCPSCKTCTLIPKDYYETKALRTQVAELQGEVEKLGENYRKLYGKALPLEAQVERLEREKATALKAIYGAYQEGWDDGAVVIGRERIESGPARNKDWGKSAARHLQSTLDADSESDTDRAKQDFLAGKDCYNEEIFGSPPICPDCHHPEDDCTCEAVTARVEKPCKACGGSGKCQTCYNMPGLSCRTCGSSGRCPACGGTGKEGGSDGEG